MSDKDQKQNGAADANANAAATSGPETQGTNAVVSTEQKQAYASQLKTMLGNEDNKLSDGRQFEIKELSGMDVIKAIREMDEDKEMMLPVMMRLSCYINGQIAFTLDELIALKAKDFLKIMTAFSTVNF